MDFSNSSISEEIKQHAPTMDTDLSRPGNEDIVSIYQRPAGLSLEVPEDFAFSSEFAELEEQLKPTTLTNGSDDVFRLLDDSESVEDRTAHWFLQSSDAAVVEGDCESKPILTIAGAKQHTSLRPDTNHTKSTAPILSFARLDQWDLDNVLKKIKYSNMSVEQGISAGTVKSHADGDKRQHEVNLMERLTALCHQQSVSAPVEKPNSVRQMNVRNKSLEKMEAELQLSHQEPPTVYLDLRCHDSSVKPAKTSLNLSPEFILTEKHNTEKEKTTLKKHNLKELTGSQTDGRDVTCKSTLLKKMREMRRNGNNPSDKKTDHLKAEDKKEKPTRTEESICSHDSHHLWVDEHSSLLEKSRKPQMESPLSPLYTKDHSFKDPQWQSEEEKRGVSHLEKDQEIQKEPQRHRPDRSVYLQPSAADRTDVLYEEEISHREPISTLPAKMESQDWVSLTVSLSGPGMIESLNVPTGKRKHLFSSETKSHIYNALVAWFLSLAGPGHTEDAAGAEVPFKVAGLQQLRTEHGLVLHVLAVAHHCSTPQRRDEHVAASFYTHVCRFLSNTSVTAIGSWLPELKNLLDQQPFTSPIHLPSSCLNTFISATSNKKVIENTFGLNPGFYWHTVETPELVFKTEECKKEVHTEVSVALGSSDFYQNPLITNYTLHLVLDSGLDVCGLRFLYPHQGFLSESGFQVDQGEPHQPVVALAVRGPQAHSTMRNITESLHPLRLKHTVQTSAGLLGCRNQEPPLLRCPQLTGQVHRELCLWFAGRIQGRGAQNPNQYPNRVASSDESQPDLSRSSSCLCAAKKADSLLTVSPAVPPRFYGQVLLTCERRGFVLMGLQRLRLQPNAAGALGLSSQQMSAFCGPSSPSADQTELKSSLCLVLLLRRENVSRHSATLPSALMREFRDQKLLGGLYSTEPNLCFHTVPYNKNLEPNYVRRMWTVPSPSGVILSRQKCLSPRDVEQVVTLTLSGTDMSQNLKLLHRVLTERPEGDHQHAGFELLGLKWLPVLTRVQAQELSPYEVGQQLFSSSVDHLMSSPALVCVLRAMDAFSSMRRLLPLEHPHSLAALMSPSPEVALRQASLFFSQHEISLCRQSVSFTVCLFKPKVWSGALVKIFSKFQQSGLTLVGLRVVTRDKKDVGSEGQRALDPGSLALCLQGQNAVKRLLDVLRREDRSPWLTCYGSRSYQQAAEDVKALFPEGECCTETSSMRQEQILSLCSDPVASAERKQSGTLNTAQTSLTTPGPPEGSQVHRAHWQTTCLLIPLKAKQHEHMNPQLEIVEQLLRSGCHLVAGRLSVLDSKQRTHTADTLKRSPGVREMMAHANRTCWLIVALQGEMIVPGLRVTLERIYRERPDLEQVGKEMVYPESANEAKQLTRYLFDALSPESCDTIVP
ncbi:dynein axonemal assembly factor 8 isoform 1-T1 [Menidia menidia]